jgi:periplasmic protein TonB
MSSALATASVEFDEFESPNLISSAGAQTLLDLKRAKPSYGAQGIALVLYALLLATALTYASRPTAPAEEDAIELVMLPPVVPEEQPAPVEQPPPVAEQSPPEEKIEPPPPIAEEPVAPKPLPKPKPKAAEHKPPVEQPRHASAAPARTGSATVPPNAIASSYANQVHARIARAAVFPHSLAHQSGRVGYHIVVSPSGSVISQSISPSGNAAFDTAAREALARAAPFPATGLTRPASLTGAIVFR